MKNKIPLIVIAGSTGIGKSNLAMYLAQKLNTDIISADSRQIYRDFDIGTAKPDINEQKLVKHHLIDIVDPQKNFTLAEYNEEAKKVINNLYNEQKIPMLVGGTGLYIKTLIQGFEVPEVEPDLQLRKELTEKAESEGKQELYEMAKKIDPVAMLKIHENDIRRVIRVIEVFKTTGKQFSLLGKKSEESIYDLIYIGLEVEREKLYQRISDRVEKMIKMGLIDEVKNIIIKYGDELPLLKTINYREIKQYLDGLISLEEAVELMKKDTRNFAKQQITWFKHDPYIKFFRAENAEDLESIKKYVINQVNEKFLC